MLYQEITPEQSAQISAILGREFQADRVVLYTNPEFVETPEDSSFDMAVASGIRNLIEWHSSTSNSAELGILVQFTHSAQLMDREEAIAQGVGAPDDSQQFLVGSGGSFRVGFAQKDSDPQLYTGVMIGIGGEMVNRPEAGMYISAMESMDLENDI